MDNNELKEILKSTTQQMDTYDELILSVARLIAGRLRAIKPDGNWTAEHLVLKDLKAELGQYNAVTGKWKP